MQHPAIQTNLTESPFTAQIMEKENESGMQSKLNDKLSTNTIIKQTTTATTISNNKIVLLPPTQMAHDLNEPKNSEKISNLTTTITKTTTTITENTDSGKMPRSQVAETNGSDDDGVVVGDAIDCAIVVQKDNCHEYISALNGSQTCENGLQSTSTSTSTSTPTLISLPSTYHKDGHYFLKLLQSEKSRLLSMAEQAERDMCVLTTNSSPNNEISDEIFGILRSVSGKTKLLVSQKFKQFEGLCHNNLNPTPDEKFPTTIEDLLGFWDMVNLQIEHIDSLFKELDLIKANNWQPTKDPTSPFVPTGSRVLKKSSLKNNNNISNNNNNNKSNTPKASPNALLMAQKRDMQRKQLLEMKRKNKNAATDKGPVSSPIEIYVTENVA